MILAGDIGGTNSRVAVFESAGLRPREVWSKTYPSANHASFTEILQLVRNETSLPIDRAGFGIAGPVVDGVCKTTNLPWTVDARDLARELGVSRVALINDLEATAWGIAALTADELVTLLPGAPGARGNQAVIAAGTGLGEAGLFWDGHTHVPWATEGGHASFSPADPLQLELLAALAAQFGHVSWERVLSGPGLVNVYRFLRDSGRVTEPEWLTHEIEHGDAAAVISQTAAAGTAPACVDALRLFVRLYAAEAANLALKVLATGGVFLGGGIAPKILQWLREPAFVETFLAKGRMQPLLARIPVRVILNSEVGLLGAARCAATR